MLEKTYSMATDTRGTPSPRGSFYLTELLAPTNAGYDPYAFGLSAYSEVLTSFGGGRVKLVFRERRIQRALGSPPVMVASGCRMPTSQPSQLIWRSEPRSRSSEGRRSQVVAFCGILWREPPAINSQNRARLSVRSHPVTRRSLFGGSSPGPDLRRIAFSRGRLCDRTDVLHFHMRLPVETMIVYDGSAGLDP